jgi:hypothetical protein
MPLAMRTGNRDHPPRPDAGDRRDGHRLNMPPVDFSHVDCAVALRRFFVLFALEGRHAHAGRPSGVRSVRTALLAAFAAAALTLTGCSTGTPGAATAPQATTDPVVWMNRVCGSLLPFQQTLKTAHPNTDDDPTAIAQSISAFLARSENAIDTSLADLDAAGPSPVAGGDAAIAELKSALMTIRTSFVRTKTALDNVDPNNAVEVASTLPTVLVSLAELVKIQDSTTDLRENSALKAAAAQAPNCQSLKSSG